MKKKRKKTVCEGILYEPNKQQVAESFFMKIISGSKKQIKKKIFYLFSPDKNFLLSSKYWFGWLTMVTPFGS